MKRVIEKKLGWNDIGVLADCYVGLYVYRQICDVAKSYGWHGDMPNMDDIEDMVWASDGIRVDWHEGAIMVMPNEWWEEA